MDQKPASEQILENQAGVRNALRDIRRTQVDSLGELNRILIIQTWVIGGLSVISMLLAGILVSLLT